MCTTGRRLTSSTPPMMRAFSSCFEVTRIWRKTERANLEEKPLLRFSHEACLGLEVNSKRPTGSYWKQRRTSLHICTTAAPMAVRPHTRATRRLCFRMCYHHDRQGRSRSLGIFRHSLGTELLRSGATLPEIGQLLRHENHDTTRIYAKVDIDTLRTLSLPWPGGVQ